jgi:hypothetical protein
MLALHGFPDHRFRCQAGRVSQLSSCFGSASLANGCHILSQLLPRALQPFRPALPPLGHHRQEVTPPLHLQVILDRGTDR